MGRRSDRGAAGRRPPCGRCRKAERAATKVPSSAPSKRASRWEAFLLYDEDLNPLQKGTPQSRKTLWGRGAAGQRPPRGRSRKAERAATKVPSSAPSKNRLINPKSSGLFFENNTLYNTFIFCSCSGRCDERNRRGGRRKRAESEC